MGPEDLLSTPSGYATPEQLASVQQYANLLLKGGQRDQPITHPLQGLRMMADTLAGRHLQNQAGQQQAQNTFGAGAQVAGAQPPGAPQPQAPGLGL